MDEEKGTRELSGDVHNLSNPTISIHMILTVYPKHWALFTMVIIHEMLHVGVWCTSFKPGPRLVDGHGVLYICTIIEIAERMHDSISFYMVQHDCSLPSQLNTVFICFYLKVVFKLPMKLFFLPQNLLQSWSVSSIRTLRSFCVLTFHSAALHFQECFKRCS